MWRKFRRQISGLLVLCLLFSLVPAPVFASEPESMAISVYADSDKETQAAEDLNTFRLYGEMGAACVRHICKKNGGIYTSTNNPDQVKITSLNPATDSAEGQLHAACTACGEETDLKIPVFFSEFFTLVGTDTGFGTFNGSYHNDIDLSIVDGEVTASDGRTYKFSELVSSMWILRPGNIKDAGTYSFGYYGGLKDGLWNGTSLFYSPNNFWFDEWQYTVDPMIVDVTFPYGMDQPVFWDPDLYNTIVKPTYVDAYGQTQECTVFFYNIDYTVEADGTWDFKTIDFETEEPLTKIPGVGIYAAMYGAKGEQHDMPDGSSVEVHNYYVRYNGQPFRAVVASVFVLPNSLDPIYVNDAGSELNYRPIYVPDMYTAIMGDTASSSGYPVVGREKISDGDLWKIELDPKVSGASMNNLSNAGTYPAQLYIRRTDHPANEPLIPFNQGSLQLTIQKRKLLGSASPYRAIIPQGYEVTNSIFSGASVVDIWVSKNTSVLDSMDSKIIRNIPVTWNVSTIDSDRIGYQSAFASINMSYIAKEVANPDNIQIVADIAVVDPERFNDEPPTPELSSAGATTITLEQIPCLVNVDDLPFVDNAERDLVRRDHTIVYGVKVPDERGETAFAWQYSNTFRGLQPDTEYTFATRYEHEPFADYTPTSVSSEVTFKTLPRGETIAHTILHATADKQIAYYGDTIHLTAEVEDGELAGVTYQYSWFKLDESGEHFIRNGDNLQLSSMSDSGLYFARCIASKDEDGSITVDSNVIEVFFSRSRILDEAAINNIKASAITYGDKLSTSTLTTVDGRALGTYSGTFAWQEPDKILEAGDYEEAVLFTPYSIVNYAEQIINIPVHVNKKELTVTLPDLTKQYGFEVLDPYGLTVAVSGDGEYTEKKTVDDAFSQKDLIRYLETLEITGWVDSGVTGRTEDVTVFTGPLYLAVMPISAAPYSSYGNMLQTGEYSYSIVTGETASDFYVSDGVAAKNYTLICTPGNLTIGKRTLQLSLGIQPTKEYQEQDPKFVWSAGEDEQKILTADGLIFGNKAESTDAQLVASRDPGEDPGEYPIYLEYHSRTSPDVYWNFGTNDGTSYIKSDVNIGSPPNDIQYFINSYDVILEDCMRNDMFFDPISPFSDQGISPQVSINWPAALVIYKKSIRVSYDGPLISTYNGLPHFDPSKVYAMLPDGTRLPIELTEVSGFYHSTYMSSMELPDMPEDDKILVRDPGNYYFDFKITEGSPYAEYYQLGSLFMNVEFNSLPKIEPAELDYGDLISNAALPEISLGTYAWKNPSSVLAPGTHEAEAVFTPSDLMRKLVDVTTLDGYDAAVGNINMTGQITVRKRAALLAEDVVVNQRKVYDGTQAAAVMGANAVKILPTDDAELAVTATYASKDVGTEIPITVHFELTGADAAKYTVPADYTLQGEITKAPLIVKANDLSVMFGYSVEDALKSGTLTVSGFVNGETASVLSGSPVYSTTYKDLEDIPSKRAEVTVSGYTSDNYNISYLPGELRITKLPISAGIKSMAKVYGQEDPAQEIVYEIHGPQGKDPVAGLDDLIRSALRRMVASREEGEAMGTYAYTYAFPPSNNFEFEEIPATMTIGQVVAEVLWGGLDQIFKADGTDQGNKITAKYDSGSGLVDLTVAFTNQAGQTVPFKEPGVYTVTASSGNSSVALNNAHRSIRMQEPDPVAPNAPGAPQLRDRTDSSITLAAIADAQYSIDGGMTWQNSPTFSGLKPKTEYSFIARVIGENGLISEPSPVAKYTTLGPADTRGPIKPPALSSKTSTQIVLDAVEGAEYSIDEGKTWQPYPVFLNLKPGSAYILLQRWKATEDWPAGPNSSLLRVTTDGDRTYGPPELASKSTTRILLKLVDGAEYSIDGGKTWQDSPIFTGLKPNTTYTFVLRQKAIAGANPGKVSSPLSVKTDADNMPVDPPADTRGDIPDPVITNKTHERIFVDLVIGAEYSIDGGKNWQTSTFFSGLQPNTTYQVCQRWRATDKLPAGPTSKIISVTTDPGEEKDPRPALTAPTLASKTSTQVVLNAIEGVEYTMDEGVTWQDLPVFTGLTPDTSYAFRQRYKKTDTLPAGEKTAALVVRTDAAGTPTEPDPPMDDRPDIGKPVVAGKSHNSITLTPKVGAEYSIDRGRTWQKNNVFLDLSPETTYFLLQRWAATDTLPAGKASEPTTVVTDAEPVTPPDDPVDDRGGVPAIEIESKGIDYITVKPTPGAEYSIDGGANWQDNNTFMNLESNRLYTIHKRWKATDALPAGAAIFTSCWTLEDPNHSTPPTTDPSTPTDPVDPSKPGTPEEPAPEKDTPSKRAAGNGFNSIVASKDTIQRPVVHGGGSSVVIPVVGAPLAGSEENCQSSRFSDVDHNAWYHRAIDFNIANKLMVGTSATTWSPNTSITRSQFLTVLYRLAGSPSGYTLEGKTDAKPGMWFYDAAAWAYAMGITGGTSETEFSPNEGMTFQQLAVMIYRFCEVYGIACPTAEIPTEYDVSSVPGYASAAMQAVAQTGIFNLQGSTSISVNTVVTRAQTAQVMANICTQFNTQLMRHEVLKVPTTLFSTVFSMLSGS